MSAVVRVATERHVERPTTISEVLIYSGVRFTHPVLTFLCLTKIQLKGFRKLKAERSGQESQLMDWQPFSCRVTAQSFK